MRAFEARLSRQRLGLEPRGRRKRSSARSSRRVASWPKFASSVSFDAITFTRSLHHINPLGEAIARARQLLNPSGLLLIEDFALDEVDEATVAWFVKVLRSEQGKASINPIADQLATELLSASDVMETWRRNRAHDLHSFTAMNEAIAARFVIRESQSVPYFYRYLVPVNRSLSLKCKMRNCTPISRHECVCIGGHVDVEVNLFCGANTNFFSNFTITTISRIISRMPTTLQIHIIHIGHIIITSHLLFYHECQFANSCRCRQSKTHQ